MQGGGELFNSHLTFCLYVVGSNGCHGSGKDSGATQSESQTQSLLQNSGQAKGLPQLGYYFAC